jgi:hypothetical protein
MIGNSDTAHGFFEFVHHIRCRGKALLPSLQYLRQKLAKRERLSTIRFLPSKAKNEKGTTAHGRYNNRFTVFKPMSR